MIHLPGRLAIAAVVAFVAVACASASQPASVTPSSPAQTDPVQTSPSAEPSSPDPSPEAQGPPVWAIGLEAQLQCDGPPQSTGAELGDIGPDDGTGGSPQDALAAFLVPGEWVAFPASGFNDPIGTEHWARHEYTRLGAIRAIAVSTNLEPWAMGDGSWSVIAIRACDPSEFDPSDGLTFDLMLWLDEDGTPARSDVISAIPGPGHCEWESALLLRLGDALYLRDPEGVLKEHAIESFVADAELPDSATDTGFHTTEWRLFTASDGDAVYVRTSDGTFERWGRSRDPFLGCA